VKREHKLEIVRTPYTGSGATLYLNGVRIAGDIPKGGLVDISVWRIGDKELRAAIRSTRDEHFYA
jgi:hypothetical protein